VLTVDVRTNAMIGIVEEMQRGERGVMGGVGEKRIVQGCFL
jgi:hypothetical protein